MAGERGEVGVPVVAMMLALRPPSLMPPFGLGGSLTVGVLGEGSAGAISDTGVGGGR